MFFIYIFELIFVKKRDIVCVVDPYSTILVVKVSDR